MSGLRVTGTCLLAPCSEQARPPLLFCLAPSPSSHPAPLLITWGRPPMKHHCRSQRIPQPLPPRLPCHWASLLLTWKWLPLYLQRRFPHPPRFPPPRLQLQVALTETSDVGPVGSSKQGHVVQMPAGVTSSTCFLASNANFHTASIPLSHSHSLSRHMALSMRNLPMPTYPPPRPPSPMTVYVDRLSRTPLHALLQNRIVQRQVFSQPQRTVKTTARQTRRRSRRCPTIPFSPPESL